MRITRKQTTSALAGIGILIGSAGLASAATSGTSTPADPAAQPPAATAAGPHETAGGVESDEANEGPEQNEADETNEGPEQNEADETNEQDETSYSSSITVADSESGVEADESSQLAGLATVTADQASQAALASQPGTVTGAQLENENGNVVYSVIVDTGNGLVDVKVDAGDGAVLASEADDGSDEGQDGTDDEQDGEQDDADEAPGSEVANG